MCKLSFPKLGLYLTSLDMLGSDSNCRFGVVRGGGIGARWKSAPACKVTTSEEVTAGPAEEAGLDPWEGAGPLSVVTGYCGILASRSAPNPASNSVPIRALTFRGPAEGGQLSLSWGLNPLDLAGAALGAHLLCRLGEAETLSVMEGTLLLSDLP